MYETIPDFLRHASEKYGDKIALYIRRFLRTTRYSYRELADLSLKIASYLLTNDVKSGDCVLIWAPNMPEWVLALFGALSAGIVVVPVGLHSTSEVVEKYIDQTKPKVLFLSKFYPIDFKKSEHKKIQTIFLEDLPSLAESQKIVTLPVVHKSSLAEIVFTSGTTGEPKGVMISHHNILFEIAELFKIVPRYRHYRLLSVLPLSHVMEQVVGLIGPLTRGATIYYIPRINAVTIKKALAKYHITDLGVVPQMLRMFLDTIEYQVEQEGDKWLFDLMLKMTPRLPIFLRRRIFGKIHQSLGNKLYVFGVGSAPLDIKLAQAWEAMGVKVVEGYGASETTGGVTANRVDHRKLGSVGKKLSEMEIEFSSEKEILVKGDNVTKGYFENEEKTKASFDNLGFFRTGDVGYFDKDGYLYITGREKFKIVTAAGDKVYPEDVERKLNAHPDVWDSCVMGIKKNDGEIVYAALILKEKAKNKLGAIVGHVNLGLEPNQQILDSSLWPEKDFPRLYTLKIDRNKVKEIIEDGLTGEKTTTLSLADSKDKLKDILIKVCKVADEKIHEESKLVSDLGLDSLKRIELISLIEEEFEVEIGEEQLNLNSSVKDLRKLLIAPKKMESPYDFDSIVHTLNTKWISDARVFFESFLLFPFIKTFFRISKNVEANWGEIPNGFVFIGNHPGYFDVFMFESVLPIRQRRRLIKLADDVSWDWRASIFFRWKIFDALFGILPINKTGYAMMPTFETVLDFLENGKNILIAPEGRFTPKGSSLGVIKDGVATLFSDTKIKLVPYWVEGQFNKTAVDHITSPLEVMAKPFTRFHVAIGKPFTLEGLAVKAATAKIRSELLETAGIAKTSPSKGNKYRE